MARLSGKSALITAAAQGIGRAAVIRFREEGADVIAVDRDGAALAALARESGCRPITADLTEAGAFPHIASQVARLDVLFNCAGFVHEGTLLECGEEDWSFSFSLNVSAMWRLTRLLAPVMIAGGGGSIINMSSVASCLKAVPRRFVYSATKAAVIGMTKSIAADFIGDGIRCNAICPGTVDTPSLEQRMRRTGSYEDARKAYVARQPMGRLGTPLEIANLAVYLASEESAYTTGQCHVIDGGLSQ